MERTKDCGLYEHKDQALKALGLKPDMSDIVAAVVCNQQRDWLQSDGRTETYISLPRYLGLNLAVILTCFTTIFVLFLLVAELVRRYWLWLKA
jgi:hypothetical protein